MEMVNTEGTIAASVEGCAAGALTTDCTGPAQISQFNAFADPSTPSTACKKDLVGTCGYSIANSTGDGVATSGNYQICFSLEEASGSLAAGPHAINPGGQFGDCN
ncbi:MAG: hypothetical protein NTZ18_03035 [Candidatus Komeilibacteria bacterium]|nr:hypothetical protein [Candidatus Komeilibacteria bacterium]